MNALSFYDIQYIITYELTVVAYIVITSVSRTVPKSKIIETLKQVSASLSLTIVFVFANAYITTSNFTAVATYRKSPESRLLLYSFVVCK